jgi:hypothetical protein
MLPNPFQISGRQPKTADCWDGTHPGLNKLYSYLWENTRLNKECKEKNEIFIQDCIISQRKIVSKASAEAQ